MAANHLQHRETHNSASMTVQKSLEVMQKQPHSCLSSLICQAPQIPAMSAGKVIVWGFSVRTTSVSASTTSFMKARPALPLIVFFMGLKELV